MTRSRDRNDSQFRICAQTDDMPITVRIETDAVSATDAMEQSAEAFAHDTGIQVVVEKYGYRSSMEKATEDLVSRTGKYDIVVQNHQALGKFASQEPIFSIDELEKESGKKMSFEDDLFPNAWRGLSWYSCVEVRIPACSEHHACYQHSRLTSRF